jgi:hypothetical protein
VRLLLASQPAVDFLLQSAAALPQQVAHRVQEYSQQAAGVLLQVVAAQRCAAAAPAQKWLLGWYRGMLQ